MSDRGDDYLMTPSEVGDMFRVDPKTVTRWANSGLLASVRTLGGHRRFWRSDVERLLTSHDPGALLYLLWSNKHGRWWKANALGYTEDVSEAGRYTEHEAVRHVVKSAFHADPKLATVMVVEPPTLRKEPDEE